MALDDADKAWIQGEIRRTEDHLGTKITLASEKIATHLTDNFAHGWDHRLVERSQAQMADWQNWRDGVNRWRWMITGALIITSVEIPVIAAIAVAFVGHR